MWLAPAPPPGNTLGCNGQNQEGGGTSMTLREARHIGGESPKEPRGGMPRPRGLGVLEGRLWRHLVPLGLLMLAGLLISCSRVTRPDKPAVSPPPATPVTSPTLGGTPINRPPAPADPTAYAPSVVVLWNEAMLAAIRHGPPRPTVIARSLFMVHTAIYDAWSLYDDVARPLVANAAWRRPVPEHTEANQAAAVSQAAYHMLVALFPDYEARTAAFTRLMYNLGYPIQYHMDNTPAGLGYAVARAVLADRADDGSNAAYDYADTTSAYWPELYRPVNSPDPFAENGLFGVAFDPNRWEPLRVPTGKLKDALGYPTLDPADPTSYTEQVFLTPHWGAVRPFALASGDQFRPPGPPKAGSDAPYMDALGRRMTNDQAYHLQVDEILHLSANLTDEQKVIAEYWADGPRSETPPGHWNALAHGISARDHHTIGEDARLYFALNGALFDASIAAWDAKRAYDCIRPVSAIRRKYAGQMVTAWAGPNQGSQPIPGERWRPYQDLTFVTPPFAEYVSGHSAFSAAAATVLTLFTGSNRFYDGKTILYHEDFNQDGVPDMLGQHIVAIGGNRFESSPAQVIVLQWETFQEAADEAGISRRYGGIHFQDGDLRGRDMGQYVGTQAFDLATKLWRGLSPP
uniref:Phosphatase PAP2 family protein n=2 Tax=Litorilinea aerophila TaxID=1204385 RepID=A0A540VG25_9CHLR